MLGELNINEMEAASGGSNLGKKTIGLSSIGYQITREEDDE